MPGIARQWQALPVPEEAKQRARLEMRSPPRPGVLLCVPQSQGTMGALRQAVGGRQEGGSRWGTEVAAAKSGDMEGVGSDLGHLRAGT